MGKKEIMPLRNRRRYPSSRRGSPSQTRNQRKRVYSMVKTALLVVALLIGWVLCMRLFLADWVHPAEQHITGTAYAASIMGEDTTWA